MVRGEKINSIYVIFTVTKKDKEQSKTFKPKNIVFEHNHVQVG